MTDTTPRPGAVSGHEGTGLTPSTTRTPLWVWLVGVAVVGTSLALLKALYWVMIFGGGMGGMGGGMH